MQNDFMPAEALPVKGADEIIIPILNIVNEFDCVIVPVERHPTGPCSLSPFLSRQKSRELGKLEKRSTNIMARSLCAAFYKELIKKLAAIVQQSL
jgi:hypothetical protein